MKFCNFDSNLFSNVLLEKNVSTIKNYEPKVPLGLVELKSLFKNIVWFSDQKFPVEMTPNWISLLTPLHRCSAEKLFWKLRKIHKKHLQWCLMIASRPLFL